MNNKEVIDLNEEKIEEEVINLDSQESKVCDESAVKKRKRKQNIFLKFKNWFLGLSKKKKIIFCSIVSFFVLLIIGLIVYFVCFSSDEEVVVPESVVFEMDNYKYIDGFLYFYDNDDVELGSYECKNKSEESCSLAISSLDEYLDYVHNVYEDESLVVSYVPIFDDMVYVTDGEDVILYSLDLSEDVYVYSSVSYAYEGYVILSDEDGFYLASMSDGFSLVTSDPYDYIGYSSLSSNFVYNDNFDYGIMSDDGSILTSGISGSVINYNDDVIVTTSGSVYYAYDYDLNKITTSSTYVKIYDDYIYSFTDSLVYAFDLFGNKINEVGIASDASEFTDYNIYTLSGSLSESVRAVDYEKSSEKSLVINDETFNVYESLINGGYDYTNYISGVLYFYSDTDKTNLIGSYECSTQNSVTSSSDSYSNCYVASSDKILSSSSGTLPIINDRFVFIYDTATLNVNVNISLYDLSSSSTLASYTSVDVLGLSSYDDFVDDSALYILAKNTDGELGMIMASTTKVSGVISFDYESISTLDEYYILTDFDGNNFIYDSTGKCTNANSEIQNDIIYYDGTYIKVSVSSGEQLYSLAGQIVSDAYSSIVIGNTMYMATNADKSIEIYKFGDMDTNYFNEEYSLSYSYSEFTEISSSEVSVSLFDSSGSLIESFNVSVG